ncbi:MAG: FAD-dependent oxidoreductase [Rhodobacterales bacterium]|nr:MAG: FAD-dependent oxidoreductase [Rhodobacterales bacterium]
MVELTVRGAGIFGLSVAYAALKQGARVRVIDPAGPGAGASGGIVGALAPHVPENWNPKKAFQFESLCMAEGFWAEVATLSGQSPGYGRTGRLQPIADEAGIARAEARALSAAELWQGRFRWEVRDEAPEWAPVSPTGKWIFDDLTARMRPRGAVAALVGAIEVLGGEVAKAGPYEGRVVWATGAAGLVDLSARVGKNVGGAVKGQSALLAYEACDLPQLFADGVHIVPHEDGTVAVGSTSEREFDTADGVDALLDDVLEKCVQVCPQLAGAEVIERWAGLRPRARSRAPMLGAWPDKPGHFIANGGFKIGFGMAPLVGQVMADLALNGTDAIPDGFRVEDNL